MLAGLWFSICCYKISHHFSISLWNAILLLSPSSPVFTMRFVIFLFHSFGLSNRFLSQRISFSSTTTFSPVMISTYCPMCVVGVWCRRQFNFSIHIGWRYMEKEKKKKICVVKGVPHSRHNQHKNHTLDYKLHFAINGFPPSCECDCHRWQMCEARKTVDQTISERIMEQSNT